MRIISLSTLKVFWADGSAYQDAQESALAWYRDVSKADWATPSAVKAQFGTASAEWGSGLSCLLRCGGQVSPVSFRPV